MLKRNRSETDLSSLFCEEVITDPSSLLQEVKDTDSSCVDLNSTIMSGMGVLDYSMSTRMSTFSRHNKTTVRSVLFPNIEKDEVVTMVEIKKALEFYYHNLRAELMTVDPSPLTARKLKGMFDVASSGYGNTNDANKQLILERKKQSGVLMKVVNKVEQDQVIQTVEVDFIAENKRQLMLAAQRRKKIPKWTERKPVFAVAVDEPPSPREHEEEEEEVPQVQVNVVDFGATFLLPTNQLKRGASRMVSPIRDQSGRRAATAGSNSRQEPKQPDMGVFEGCFSGGSVMARSTSSSRLSTPSFRSTLKR